MKDDIQLWGLSSMSNNINYRSTIDFSIESSDLSELKDQLQDVFLKVKVKKYLETNEEIYWDIRETMETYENQLIDKLQKLQNAYKDLVQAEIVKYKETVKSEIPKIMDDAIKNQQ